MTVAELRARMTVAEELEWMEYHVMLEAERKARQK
jgi:hypothetical protein